MYLSRLILNPRSRRVQKEVADPYQMHRSIMRGYPDDLRDGDERVLFRLETDLRQGRLALLVQSCTPPDWSWLAEPGGRGYLLPVGEPNPAVKPFELALAQGQALAFRLRANPTARRRLANGERGRVGLRREEEQLAWLERKGQQSGFDLLSARTSDPDRVSGWIPREDVVHKLSLFSVQFDGLLRVTEPRRVEQAVHQGIGSGKAFGFGLLSLARPRG